MVQRKEYLENLKAVRDKRIIKVITGVRRCGKSTLFELYIDYLRQCGVENERIISINLEDLDNADLLDYKELYNHIASRLIADKTNYIFIDEVQRCRGFEKAVDSLFIKNNCDVYITGSNAYLLSGELATLLSGRYVQIDMLPFSFSEYYEATKSCGKSKEELFNSYLQYGSFPYVAYLENDEKVIEQYIDGIYNTILLKDVVSRKKINDVSVLENILKTVASSIGSPISVKKLSDTLVSSGRKISPNTVEAYLRALTDSYILYSVPRYDVKGKQFLKTLGKYYFVDTGIRNHIINQSAGDLGHLLENIVYLELLRRNNRVNIGKLAEREIDFVTVNMNEISYYQVSASVLDKKTLERELTPLREIKDNFPKTLLTLDNVGKGTNYEGIKQKNIIDWLLES